MEKQEILLASDSTNDLKFASAVGAALGAAVTGPLSAEEAVVRARSNPVAWILVNVSDDGRLDCFTDAFQSALIDPQRVHLIGSDRMERLEELCENPLFAHFILLDPHDPEQAGRQYGQILKRLLHYRSGTASSPEEPALKFKLLRSSDRGKVLAEVGSYLETNLKVGPRVGSAMLNAVDELLMNAIFDAPGDDTGQQKLKNTPRGTDFLLESSHPVELQLHQHKDFLIFTSTDHFGTLDKTKLLKSLFRNFRDKEYRLDASVENAGLGLATTFQSGGSFLFFSERAVRTQVSVIYRNTKSYKELVSQAKYLSIHIT